MPVYLAHCNRQWKTDSVKPTPHIVPTESDGHFFFIQPDRHKDWLKVDISEVCTRISMPVLNNLPGTCLPATGRGRPGFCQIAPPHWAPASDRFFTVVSTPRKMRTAATSLQINPRSCCGIMQHARLVKSAFLRYTLHWAISSVGFHWESTLWNHNDVESKWLVGCKSGIAANASDKSLLAADVFADRPMLWLWQYIASVIGCNSLWNESCDRTWHSCNYMAYYTTTTCNITWLSNNLFFDTHYSRRFNRLDSTPWNHNAVESK